MLTPSLTNLPASIADELKKLLELDLKDPETLARLLQNLPSARSYVFEQMCLIEKEQETNDTPYLQEQHSRLRRMFFEMEEFSVNLGKILSYQTSLMKMEH